jgi:solute carrier family 40 (iron-regulated transporter), member 1
MSELKNKDFLKIYIYCFLSSWGDRLYEFISYLFIIEIFPNSLLYPSIYGFCITFSSILFSNKIGNIIDTQYRLKVIKITILLRKISIMINIIIFSYLLKNDLKRNYMMMHYIVIIFLGCILKLSSISNNISLEKDWILTISRNNEEILIRINTIIKRIDIFCKIMASLVIGLLNKYNITFTSLLFWNSISIIFEYIFIYKIYILVPELSYPKNINLENISLLKYKQQNVTLKNYIKLNIFPASLALSMLYLSVLSFGGSMISYLKYCNYTNMEISLLGSITNTMSIVVTFVIPIVIKKLGIFKTALISIWFECITLIPVVFSLIFNSSELINKIILFGGISFSRIGLLTFDITEILMLQIMVDKNNIGSVSGWQNSLCNIFDLGQFILTIIFSKPDLFYLPSIISLISIICASIIFTYFVKKNS